MSDGRIRDDDAAIIERQIEAAEIGHRNPRGRHVYADGGEGGRPFVRCSAESVLVRGLYAERRVKSRIVRHGPKTKNVAVEEYQLRTFVRHREAGYLVAVGKVLG